MNKPTLKLASRSMILMLAMALIVVMFFPALTMDQIWLSILLNVAVIAAALLFTYAGGAGQGEEEITYGEMLQKRVERGYEPTAEDKAKCFSRKRAFIALGIAALPWIIISVIVLVTGIGYTHMAVEEETVEYLFPEAQTVTLGLHEIMDIVGRFAFAAFMGLYGFIDNAGAGLLDYFFLPLSFVYPLATCIGYLTGPKQHARKLKMIEEGKIKKLRKIRNDQRRKKARVAREQKPEV